MPFRLIPIALIVLVVVLLTVGLLDDQNDSRAENELDWNRAVNGVDSVLDDALTADNFDWLHDSVKGVGRGVEDSVSDNVVE